MDANGIEKTQIHAFVLTMFRQVVATDGTESHATTEPYSPATGTWSRTVKLNSLSSAELCKP